jgi:hypothetical protein
MDDDATDGQSSLDAVHRRAASTMIILSTPELMSGASRYLTFLMIYDLDGETVILIHFSSLCDLFLQELW